jgi:syntaxin 16
MATRNQTALFRKYRDALRNVGPGSSRTGPRGGSTIELTEVFGRPKGYTTLETEDDADPSRFY